jgi:signal transduction histidine kinase
MCARGRGSKLTAAMCSTPVARPLPAGCPALHALVAETLATIAEHAFDARDRVGVDDRAVDVAAAAISRLATAALEDVRRLVDALPCDVRTRRALADEIHDVLGHGLSLASVLAGVARTTIADAPERAREALTRTAAVATGTERELAGLLHGDAADGVADPAAVVEVLREAAEPATLRTARAALDAADAGVVRSAGAIVRESLTNVRKHAPGAPVGVRVGIEDDALVVLVVNDAPPCRPAVGNRRGLAGMRRRAHAVGGHVDAGFTPAGSFRVHASLPLAGAPNR